jgi:hypothetical protein
MTTIMVMVGKAAGATGAAMTTTMIIITITVESLHMHAL